MTDTLVTSTTVNGSDINARTIADFHYPIEPVEDDGQISCFCGLNDDDGNTVACDICNKWQHIRCYYPQWAEGNIPDDLQHFCVDCKPRVFDRQGALERQLSARNRKELNGIKRPTPKTKKKPINGMRYEEGPPAKRPKTIHRTSGPQRKRSASTIHRSSESPETTTQTYSPEFLSAYANDEYATTSANCFDNLDISAKLGSWLGNPEEVFQITDGMALQDIFQRYDGDMDVIDPPVDLIEITEVYDDRFKVDGQSAMWKMATVKEPLTTQACIGELRGHVGFKEDYKADATNRWPILRHPEPFVFFHPNLPICVDARQEGTLVRYVRRSCDPNAELKVIITGAADYHFCFIATRDIAAGEEVAIAWDCAGTIRDMLSREGMDAVQAWVSIVLSNCGPCACKRQECLMAHFDKRPPTIRPPKGRRKKEHVSPLNTTAVDSRSGSEARNFEDDERDSRSATGFDSRDITPNTHYSANGYPELSERERKKLAREEEIFRRQEEQALGKQTKKKRTSGGHNLDIPRSASAKQSPGLPKKIDLPNGRKRRRTIRTPVTQRTQSSYVDAAVQCELDPDDTVAAHRQVSTFTRRRVAPLRQQLLDRCAQTSAIWHNAMKHRRASTKTEDITMKDASPSAAIPAKSPPMKLEMPPPEVPQAWTATPLDTPSSIVQSPATAAFLLSPSVQASVNTPAKKKMSLSDYTKRSKAKETEVKTDRESSPSSAISVKENLPAVSEDTTMADVGEAS